MSVPMDAAQPQYATLREVLFKFSSDPDPRVRPRSHLRGFDPHVDKQILAHEHLPEDYDEIYDSLCIRWVSRCNSRLSIPPGPDKDGAKSPSMAEIAFNAGWSGSIPAPTLFTIPMKQAQALTNKSTAIYIAIKHLHDLASDDILKAIFIPWARRYAELTQGLATEAWEDLRFVAAPVALEDMMPDLQTLIQIHQTIVNRLKDVGSQLMNNPDHRQAWQQRMTPISTSVRRSFESTLIFADGRDWKTFKTQNPGTAATENIQVTFAGRASVLEGALSGEWSHGFEDVDSLPDGEERWVQKVVSLKTAIAMILSLDDIVA